MAALGLPVASSVFPAVELPLIPQMEVPEIQSVENSSLTAIRSDLRGVPGTIAAVSRPPDANPTLWISYLPVLWLAGFVFAMSRLLIAVRAVRRLSANGRALSDPNWKTLLMQLKSELGIRRSVDLVIAGLYPPMTWGLIRDMIVLPSAAADWTIDRRRLVLAHELAHVKRRDVIVQVLAHVVCAVYWFNPLAWFAFSRLRIEREKAADDQVLRLGVNAYDYANHLVQVARTIGPLNAFSNATIAMAQPSQLEKRLKAIVDSNRVRCSLTRIETLSLVSTAIVVTILVGSLQVTARPLTPIEPPIRIGGPLPVPPQTDNRALQNWSNEEVPYIISEEERRAFDRLNSEVERRAFIDQFWSRRDPSPGTVPNEFRDEHYRRLAYVNQRFAFSSRPGWQSDRGRIFIIHGKPDELEDHPAGPGGTYPYTKWTYRYVEGIGANVDFVFIDPARNGEYRLVPRGQAAVNATPTSDPVAAVLAWYGAFQGSAGNRAQYNGYVGGRFERPYQFLDPSLKSRMSAAEFDESYAEVANMKLIQAHLAAIDPRGDRANVFVEEERTVVLTSGSTRGVPAIAWFEGMLALNRVGGQWLISGIDVRSEDIISMTYGGHQPWRGDARAVARVEAKQGMREPCVTPDPKVVSGVTQVEVCGDPRYIARLVQLHSGEWRAISLVAPPGEGQAVRIKAGDTLQINVSDMPEFALRKARLLSDGTMSLPLVGNVQAVGRTLAELAEDLERRYSRFLKDPRVRITFAN